MPFRPLIFDVTPIRMMIQKISGLTFDDTRLSTLAGGISQRMSARGIVSGDEYYRHLHQDKDELQRLLNLLTINETYFFREAAHFKLLTAKLLPELRMSRRAEPMTILCAGCSTGEEPYSVVISLLETFGHDIFRAVSVIGIDIDTNVLHKAREGCYSPISFRETPAGIVDKYFEPCGDGRRRLKEEVRKHVTFHKVNLFAREERVLLQNTDIIFYRNVSIYFDAHIQKVVFAHLASLLRDDSYLLVSATETLSHNFGLLPLIEHNGVYFFHKPDYSKTTAVAAEPSTHEKRNPPLRSSVRSSGSTPARPLPSSFRSGPASPTSRTSTTVGRNASRTEPDREALFHSAMTKTLEKRYEEALAMAERLIECYPCFARAYTLKALVLLNRRQVEESRRAARQALDVDEFCLEAHLLLGLAAKEANDYADAFKRLRDAIYIDSGCWLAHYHLAETYSAQEEAEKACKEFEIVIKVLSRGSKHAALSPFLQLTAPPDQLVHLCNQKIARLRGNGDRAGHGI